MLKLDFRGGLWGDFSKITCALVAAFESETNALFDWKILVDTVQCAGGVGELETKRHQSLERLVVDWQGGSLRFDGATVVSW